MSKYRKNEEAIIRRVKQLKGPCPDFYIIGHSTSAMERLGLKIAEVIDRQEMLPFKEVSVQLVKFHGCAESFAATEPSPFSEKR